MSDWNFSGNFTNHGAWNLNTIFITLLVTFFSLPSILSTYSITSENKVINNESYITNHKLPRKLLASALILCIYSLWITPLHFPIYSNAKIIVGENNRIESFLPRKRQRSCECLECSWRIRFWSDIAPGILRAKYPRHWTKSKKTNFIWFRINFRFNLFDITICGSRLLSWDAFKYEDEVRSTEYLYQEYEIEFGKQIVKTKANVSLCIP